MIYVCKLYFTKSYSFISSLMLDVIKVTLRFVYFFPSLLTDCFHRHIFNIFKMIIFDLQAALLRIKRILNFSRNYMNV